VASIGVPVHTILPALGICAADGTVVLAAGQQRGCAAVPTVRDLHAGHHSGDHHGADHAILDHVEIDLDP